MFGRREHDERLCGAWLLSGMDSLFEISFAADGSFAFRGRLFIGPRDAQRFEEVSGKGTWFTRRGTLLTRLNAPRPARRTYSFRGDDLILEGLPGTKIRAACTLHRS